MTIYIFINDGTHVLPNVTVENTVYVQIVECSWRKIQQVLTLLSHEAIVHHYSYVYHTGAAVKRRLAKKVYPC
jgi:hypothetical protein